MSYEPDLPLCSPGPWWAVIGSFYLAARRRATERKVRQESNGRWKRRDLRHDLSSGSDRFVLSIHERASPHGFPIARSWQEREAGEESVMLKITIHNEGQATNFVVEGKLAGLCCSRLSTLTLPRKPSPANT